MLRLTNKPNSLCLFFTKSRWKCHHRGSKSSSLASGVRIKEVKVSERNMVVRDEEEELTPGNKHKTKTFRNVENTDV